MANDQVLDYIKQSRSSGLRDEIIRQNLLNEGWPQTDIDQALAAVDFPAVDPVPITQLSPVASQSPSLISKLKSLFHKPVYIAGAAVVVLLLIFLGWKLFSGKPIPAQFVLKATVQDGAGVNPHTAFTLQSTQALSGSQIQKILKFSPNIDFSVKQISSNNLFINQAVAADSQAGSFTYQLQPKEDLKADTVYQALVDDKSYADREYGWAFQVKAAFQIIKTHPGDKTTYVPVNTGLEITFNRTNIQNIDQYFEITPKVEGRFETRDDTAVFLPKNPLPEHTVYTVTVKKGLTGQGSSDSLENDYQFSFETQSNYYQPYSYFNFTDDFVESVPGIKTDLSVYVSNVTGNDLSASVYSISNPDEFLKSYEDSRKWDWGWASYYRQNNPTVFDTKGRQPILTFKPEIVTENYQSYMEIPQELNQGMYIVDVALGSAHRQAWLQVSKAAHYFSITHDTSLLWLYDFPAKAPLPNANIEFIQSSSRQGLGSSNQDGLVQFNTPEALKQDGSNAATPLSFFKVTDSNNNISFAKIQDQWGYSRMGPSDNYWKFISTDRYTYQMTDTMKFWGVVKSRKEDVRQKKVKVALYDSSRFWDYNASFADQQPVAFTEVMVSPFNTIEGSLSFKGLDPKTYSLVVTLGSETVSQNSIQVLTYSKPAFQVTVTTSKPAIFAGESVTFKVKAAFFDGTPLNDAKLNYEGYWDKNITGEVTLDNNGEATVTLTPAYDNNPNSYWPRNLNLTFSAASSEEGEIFGTGDVTVFGPHMYLQAEQNKQTGDNYTFQAKLNNIDINNQVPDNNGGFRTEYIADPVANYPVKAKITKTTYTRVETGSYYDPINKIVNKTFEYVRNDQEIESISGTTDNNGEWTFSRSLSKADYTFYTVAFSATDREGRVVTTSAYAYYASYGSWQAAGLSLNIGSGSYEKEFSAGEPVNLAVQGYGSTNVADQPILYYRYQNNISKAVIQKSTTYSENFGNDFIPSVQYRAVILGPYGFTESNAVFATFRKSDNGLKISITTDKDGYRPGDKVTVKLHVADKNGQALAAETNVAIVDEAVFHVLPWNWQQEILDTLYQPIYTSPMTGASVYLLQNGSSSDKGAEGGGCFTGGTQILLSNGKTKSIEDIKVGDQILTLKDSVSNKLVPAIVQGISSHVVDDYLIINDQLEVTPEHKIFLNNDWNFAGSAKVGDTLTVTGNQPEIIRSIEHKWAPHTAVYNIIVGKYHTYFADGYFVHNAEKGGDSARDSFVDTAVFQTVHPDKSGNAQLDFTTPDNITSWRVTARAFDTDSLKAGEQTKLVPATLPLFINAVPSETYLVGDNPQVKIGLYGSGYNASQDAQVSVVSTGLKLNQNVTLKNHIAYVTLGQLPEGQYDLTISAKQGSLQDALKKHVTVVKSYFVKPTASTVNLSTSTANIPGNAGGFTKLSFMDAGKGKFYQDLIWASYTGGIRADQLAGSFYATDLLNNYFKEERPQDKLDLSAYQAATGGIRLFPYSDPDLELSAKLADLSADYVFGNGLGDYFMAALHDTKTDLHRQAVALYGLASLGKPVLTRLQAIQAVSELAWQDKIYVALGMSKLGAIEEARTLYQQAIRSHLHFDGPQAWYEEIADETNRIKLTDLTAVLATDVNLPDDANVLWNYMELHVPIRDLDILEKMMFIKSAIAKSSQNEAKFHYQTNARAEDVTIKKGDTYSVTLSADELGSIKFGNISGQVQVTSFYEENQDPGSLAKDGNLSITRQYVVNGKVTTNFQDGDIVRVKLFPKVGAAALDGNYQIVDYLPSGMKPVTDPYTFGISQGYGCLWYPQKVVNNKLYFTVPKNFKAFSSCEPAIQYFARVVTKGDFTANPALIQSALNPNDLNISASTKVNIK